MSRNRQFPQKSKRRSPSKQQKQNMVVDVQNTQVVRVEPDTRKKFSIHDVKDISPLTDNQELTFKHWDAGQNMVLEGYAGTGKTFLALYLALCTVLDNESDQRKIVIVRSAVPSRQIGFLPGTEDEKLQVYERPYMQICDELFKWKNSYKNLKDIGLIEFESTSFLRGCTYDDAIIIFDEFQNSIEQELETVISRVGINSRLILCGDDVHQNDVGGQSGGKKILPILRKMESVSFVDFEWSDCVRSGFVKEFLKAKYGK